MVERGVSELVGLLQGYRDDLFQFLTEAPATTIATERLTARYFPGLKILFKSYIKALDEVAERVQLLADEYNALADYIEGEDRVIFDAGFASRIEKIDQNATDQAAKESVDTLQRSPVALAKAEMFLFFDQTYKAADILKPMIRDEAGEPQRPGV